LKKSTLPLLATVLLLNIIWPALPFSGSRVNLFAEVDNSARKNYFHECTETGLKNITVKIPNGIIVATGSSDVQNILVKGEFVVQGKKLDVCRQLIDDIDVTCETEDHTLNVEVTVKDKKHYDVNAFFEIETPENVNVEFKAKKGLIDIRNIRGSAALHITTGDGYCANIAGNVNFFVLNGGINIEETSGRIEGIAGNGGITVTGAELIPSALDLLTINGSTRLALKRVPNASISASTANGFIHLVNEANLSDRLVRSYESILGQGGSAYEIQSLNGSIIIDLPTTQ